MDIDQTKVNKEAIQEWVAALRSGKYVQGFGWLTRNGTYCCLGVACDLFAKKLSMPFKLTDPEDHIYSWNGYTQDLPPVVNEFLGLSPSRGGGAPVVILSKDMNLPLGWVAGDENDLISLNDDWHWGFNEIADAIEQTYLGGDE